MIAIDTNVLVDLAEGEAPLAARTLDCLERAAGGGQVAVCGAVFAELCSRREPSEVRALLAAARIGIDERLPLEAWAHAGRAYGEYAMRRRTSGGGATRRLLVDFVIGAHAVLVGGLLTNDAAFYRRAFPDLRVESSR